MPSVFYNSATERGLYNQARESLINAGVSPEAYDAATNTQSYLRLIQPLTATGTNFNFPVLNNQGAGGGSGTVRLDELRLTQQNAFFIAKINVFIFKGSSATATNVLPNTYPNAITYPTGAVNLYQFYRGKIQVVINNSVTVPAYPMQNFLQIPQSQLTAATNSPQDQFDGSAVLPWEPNVSFVGWNDNQIQIVLPGAIGTIDVNTFAQIELQGILSQNVALGSYQRN